MWLKWSCSARIFFKITQRQEVTLAFSINKYTELMDFMKTKRLTSNQNSRKISLAIAIKRALNHCDAPLFHKTLSHTWEEEIGRSWFEACQGKKS
jgi:hypothetical protein